MNVAILYSGYIRNLPETIYNNLDCFNGASNIDLYFSVWDRVGYVSNINSPDFLHSQRLLAADTAITESTIINIVPRNFSIKRIKIETYNPTDYKFDLINGTNDNINAQFYKIYDCCKLLDKNIEYDVVARMRCDFLINKKMDNSILLDLVKEDKIIFASKIWYNYTKEDHINHINDMFWITNPNIIDRTCNIYNNSYGINKVILDREQEYNNYGEDIVHMNLEAENLTRNIYTFDFDYNILR